MVMKRISLIAISCLVLVGCHQNETKKSYLKRREYEKGESVQMVQRLSYAELKTEKDRLAKNGDYYTTVRYIEQMIKKCNNPDELRALRLEFADTLFFIGKYDEAAQEYQQFMQLYPSSTKAPYAEYQSMDALCKQVLSPDRDQERAKNVVERATDFAKKMQRPEYKAYESRVTALADHCLRRLYESDTLHFYFYLNRNQFKAAQERLSDIKEKYLKYLPTLEPDMLELEYELAQARNDKKQACELLKTLNKKFPKHVLHPEKRRGYASVFYEML